MKKQTVVLSFFLIYVLVFIAQSCQKPIRESDPEPDPDPDPIKTYVCDIDSNEYKVKQFGNTLWMMENLRVTRYDTKSPRSGDTVAIVINNQTIDVDRPYYRDGRENKESQYTDNLTSEIRKSLGFLYNWCAATGVVENRVLVNDSIQGICPNGWRLPITKDWDSLFYYLGGVEIAGKKLKSVYGWYQLSGSGTNESGLNCYPAGLAIAYNVALMGQQTMFWCSISHPLFSQGQVCRLFYNRDDAEMLYINKFQANSVRCVKDL
ncbi:MAG: fibrobacter succinogenes major paralogous domain-containing protein [Bacteroidales bacterium]|jgi:uncharacterized protein (TIGR02145 family)|nr:fibrobacter succinogenes major paralogous domain-containing protein [Bacteroidales bacterium]